MRACGARQGKESKVRTLIQAFRTKELRNKILFVLGMIIIYRIGSFIPLPGVDYTVVQQCANDMTNNQENFIGLVNLFSGGAMLQLSIFALGVMPYITASIVIQLLRVVIPRFEALHKEGQSGEAKLTQYTRYLTIGLAVLQSTTIVVTANSGALFNYQCSDVYPERHPVVADRHGARAHGRHRSHHVDGRAHHREGHRPGHVRAHLHVHLLRLPAAAVGDRLGHQRHRRRLAQVRHRRGRAARHPGLRRLRRALPAPHPGAVHAPHDRP